MPNESSFSSRILFLLSLITLSVSLIIISFNLALTHENNEILLGATVTNQHVNQGAFRVATCDVAAYADMKTRWRTVELPAETVTETVTETMKVLGVKKPTGATSVRVEASALLTLVPHSLPTKDSDGSALKKKMAIRGGSRNPHLVDVNKPEIQM
ncbi:hypothetical protein AUEXF2481DRAFT_3470 [Aureobasidium subglaciale EXF-2481]|uniref:Uncharacterized protein n=1 Tax=Aureobasidium subglaciale (strain EXF-2481) TaxID=1043005 RepID=A0A074YGC1_AURSE|nr:uncharacterized protein AUEXF2481DRAFT_3470 [Aureobasidium subglaciale EXF-2481]KAI5209367.1 hypothetical protein E4T38_02481 [Aureobasidium subglaciale]KAI5228051.1 hypothetical protein E4T40_02260 [Aureobasidium subglaciale]KAI5231511.1 hypothetical protein E4T41_02480 [Aureobasidium subglaciale]KAI5265550.1 hypothetical protein E4T46_02258 [Aureobasidium subglaciale]KEQ96775.1 hypothetical protein AUEXF2481DRAFT_3470 [Aureobasidium subglaciale EXF-2481]